LPLQSHELNVEPALVEVAHGARVLCRQERSDAVAVVQAALIELGFLNGHADGKFGGKTLCAVLAFQTEQGVPDSGEVDQQTLHALDRALVAENIAHTSTPVGGSQTRYHSGARQDLVAVFHSAAATSSEYEAAVSAWPGQSAIWSALKTRQAREAWVRYLAHQDDTNARPYDDFDNLCTGFAAQIFVRYSSRSRLSARALATLKDVAVHAGVIPAKLRVPVYMVINRGHAFNAFLIEEGHPRELDSYMIYEPQNDAFIDRSHDYWAQYIERYGISLCDLEDFTDTRQYTFSHLHEFILNGAGRMVRASSDRVANLAKDFAIAESGDMNFNHYVGRAGSFEEFLRQQASQVWGLQDREIIEVGRLILGRLIRTHVDGVPKPMTAQRFVEILGRPDLFRHLA